MELAAEEIGFCPIGVDPVTVKKEIVNFIWEDQLFKGDVALAED